MEIEIVDAYPLITKSGKQSGWSMAIYLIDLDMDLRGILATKTKKGWFFIEKPSFIAIMDTCCHPTKCCLLENIRGVVL